MAAHKLERTVDLSAPFCNRRLREPLLGILGSIEDDPAVLDDGQPVRALIEQLIAGHYGYSLAYSLDSFAALAFAQNQPERAERDQLLEAIKATLTSDAIASLITRGRRMPYDQAVEFALS